MRNIAAGRGHDAARKALEQTMPVPDGDIELHFRCGSVSKGVRNEQQGVE